MSAPNSSETDQRDPPSPTFLRRLEKASISLLCSMLDIPDRPKSEKPARLTPAQEDQIREIEVSAVAGFIGDVTQLEAALGMLRMGHYMGWRVLYIIHSKKTVRTYEEILHIKVRDVFAETGPYSERSIGLNIARRYTNFWKVAGGDIKIPRRQEML